MVYGIVMRWMDKVGEERHAVEREKIIPLHIQIVLWHMSNGYVEYAVFGVRIENTYLVLPLLAEYISTLHLLCC